MIFFYIEIMNHCRDQSLDPDDKTKECWIGRKDLILCVYVCAYVQFCIQLELLRGNKPKTSIKCLYKVGSGET